MRSMPVRLRDGRLRTSRRVVEEGAEVEEDEQEARAEEGGDDGEDAVVPELCLREGRRGGRSAGLAKRAAMRAAAAKRP